MRSTTLERPRVERKRMNDEARRLWVRELEAYAVEGLGEFARGRLREDRDTFDALGLLVEVYDRHAASWRHGGAKPGWDEEDGDWAYAGQAFGLPEEVGVWAGLFSPNPFLDSGDPATTGTIAYLTDQGLGPRELAALVERHL